MYSVIKKVWFVFAVFNVLNRCECIKLTYENINNFKDPSIVDPLSNQGFDEIEPRALEKFRGVDFGFQNNLLPSLPADLFSKNTRFQRLLFARNLIREVHPLVFAKLKKLTEVYLSFNLLESLDGATFKNNVKLERIFLSNNKLKALNGEIFAGLTHLKVLDVSNNRLHAFNVHSLSASSRLNQLFMDSNELLEIDYDYLTEFSSSLQKLSLTGNNFNCSFAESVVEYLANASITLTEKYWKSASSISCISDAQYDVKRQENEVVKLAGRLNNWLDFPRLAAINDHKSAQHSNCEEFQRSQSAMNKKLSSIEHKCAAMLHRNLPGPDEEDDKEESEFSNKLDQALAKQRESIEELIVQQFSQLTFEIMLQMNEIKAQLEDLKNSSLTLNDTDTLYV